MNYKHKVVLLLVALFVNLGAFSQNLNLILSNVTVYKAMTELKSQTGYSFVYEGADLNTKKRVTVNAQSVDEAAKQILQGQNVTYEIQGKSIIVRHQIPVEAPRKEEVQQQKSFIKASGRVTDEKGEPIIGATVKVKGSSNGTVTDLNGNFNLNVEGDTYLDISYIGYRPKSIKALIGKYLSIKMEEDTKAVDEVVVVGYGTQKKINLTGSVSVVTAKELANKPVSSTAQALAGLVPGLSVLETSGLPGSSATVKIRGTGTFSSAGTDPLVLIDGLSGNIDDVDPNDIESISFLKDAASASIYGNRAANGVILIETKKGGEGKTTISYNGQFGWQKATELPDFLPSWEYAKYYNMAMENMGRQDAYTESQIEKYRNGSDPDNYPNVNHLKWLLESGSGFQHQHNISIQGGAKNTTYNLSVGYRKQYGMTDKTSNERLTALFSLKSEIVRNLTFNLNLNAYNNNYKAPNGEPQSIQGIIGYTVREAPIFAGKKTDGSFGYQDNYSPEAWLASESFVNNISRNISVSGRLSWKTPIKGLILTGKIGANFWTDFDKTYLANTYFSNTKTVGPASLSISSSNNTYTTLETYANYERVFGANSIKILLGSSVEQTNDKGLSGYRNTFPNNYLYELSSGDASTATNNSNLSEYALLSYFGRINYSYLDRYLFEVNMRYDGSSRFAEGHRWGVFPSVSAGWRISEESFWKNSFISKVIDYLKFRGSYGVLGNQNIGVYPYQQTYSLGYDYPFGGILQSGAAISTYLNHNITWEKTAIADLGLDFSLSHGVFTGTLDYFYKYTSDILSSVEVSSIMGMSVGQSNVGAVSNKGIEVNLTYNGHIGKDFRYTISPNFTWIKNAVEKLSNGATEEINNNRIVGEPIGIIYGYKTDGLFVDQAEIDAAPEQLVSKSNIKPGYIKYMDISGPDGVPDGKVDAQYDRTVLGSTTPKFYYGMNITANYKGFDFSVLLQGLGGYKRLIGSYMAYAFYNGGQIQRWQAEKCWTTQNPNKWAEYPRIETLNMNNTNLQTSDYWIRDASFLRLKTLQIGYSIPKNIVKKIGIQSMRIYLCGQNLLSINSFYKGWDPENEIGTGDSPSYYPINSIYSFGINIRF
ncbi:MAG: TonB-dependent receptor [Prevotella sp.]|jgi:TonB-linked SusC/RagA family outer membrane protein|nr:TonB-dependent receptor [Prevotella sp.]MCH4181604.1 TonB-dependent receptor [Prevotella sp.]MCH4242304.1 TonB-dependent receptor [Prevotella sp.]